MLLAIAIAFFLSRMTGDPVRQMLGPLASESDVAAVQKELGLDRALPLQFVDFFGKLAVGDLGKSLRYQRSNLELILPRFALTAKLTIAALAIAIAVGIPLGMLAAFNEDGVLDRLTSFIALIAQSLPLFWLGLVLIGLFAVELRWFPAAGADTAFSVVLPAVTLSSFMLAQIARLVRSSLIDVQREPYIMLARVHGVSEFRVALIHALRNAALPVVTMIGLQVGTLLSGAVTVEFVFAWPGVGSLMMEAVVGRDFTLVQAIVVLGAAVFVLVNLAVDLLYGVIDPRIRVAGRAS